MRIARIREGRIFILNDIHGNLEILKKILKEVRLGEDWVIFNGDVIHRGKSVECMDLVMDLCEKYERCVFIIGNHEYSYVSDAKIMETYAEPIFYDEKYVSFFKKAKLACKVHNVFITHGGAARIKSIKEIEEAPIPSDVALQLCWNDPYEIKGWHHNFERGIGYLYGKDELKDFLRKVGCDFLITGHRPWFEVFDGQITFVTGCGVELYYMVMEAKKYESIDELLKCLVKLK